MDGPASDRRAVSSLRWTRPRGKEGPIGKAREIPLCVDLDGTLIEADLLHESLVLLARRRPLAFVALLLWLLRGKAAFKCRLASLVVPDPAALPYREALLTRLREERDRGRPLHLVTASDHELALEVARHLGLFEGVHGSDGRVNLAGERKRERLVALFGERGFDYAGDSESDLAVWRSARRALVVAAPPGLVSRARSVAEVEVVLEGRTGRERPLAVRLLRALLGRDGAR